MLRKVAVACIWALAGCLELAISLLEGVGFLFNDNGTPVLDLLWTFGRWQLGILLLAISAHLLSNRLFRALSAISKRADP
jgi:hypothetical protein